MSRTIRLAGSIILLLSLSLPLYALGFKTAADFSGGLKMRFDNGKEVDPSSLNSFPDNRTDRAYIEGLLTAELLFKDIKFGDKLRLGLRVLEFQPSDVDGVLFGLEDETTITDKIYAQLNYGKWEFWAGDVYETFGRGLALNLFENRDLYFDSGLRGGKVSYRSRKIRFKAIYGTSRKGYLVEEENIGGINFEYRPTRDLELGASVVHQEGLFYEKHYTPEIYAGYEFYPVSIYAEYAQKRNRDFDMLEGEGLFSSLTAAVAGIAAQLNYKYYHFGEENPFPTPPIVQREFTTKLLSSHPHLPYIDDQVGLELDLSASPHELTYLTLNVSQSSRHDGGNPLPVLKQEFAPFWEIFLEGEYYARSDLTTKFAVGWNEESRSNYWQEKIGSLAEAIYNVSDLWSVTLLAERMWVDDIGFSHYYTDNYLALTLGRAPYGSFSFSYENSSLESNVEGDEWIGGELAMTIKTQHRLTLFYGRERGGLKCTSGVCRPVQPFEGFRIGYEGRF